MNPNKLKIKLSYTLLFILCLLGNNLFAQKTTSVHGKVIDAQTKEGLSYATVQIPDANLGTRTDIDGNFLIDVPAGKAQLRFSYVGYTTKTVTIKPGATNELVVDLVDASVSLKEVEVRPDKYRRKNNPAVNLIKEVFDHKDQNRKEGLDFYSYEGYEKLQLDLNNVTDKFRNRRALRKFQFIFENVDTNQVNRKVALPVYLRERLLNVVYRKDPKETKEYVTGEKQAGLQGYVDGDGVSAYLNNMYQKVDIYDGNIALLGTQFVGPLSTLAPTLYRFYIMDTLEFQGTRCADIFFAPASKSDLAFMGNILVALDSTYAVRKVQMGISKEINLNWVSDLHIDQEFKFFGEGANRRLMLVKDDILMDFQIIKAENGRSILGHKTVSYRNYTLNQPIPDSLFRNQLVTVITKDATNRNAEFWDDHRHTELSKTESGIYKMVDSVQNVPAFRRASDIALLLLAGYKSLAWFDLGPVNTFYSFNDVEGFRMRLGGRTNTRLVKNLLAEWYGAYGTKDKVWKYYGGLTYAFTNKVPRNFPMNQITVSYQNEIQIPGQDLQFVQEDNFLLSFKRGVNNKMIYNRAFKIDYVHEMQKGLTYTLSANRVSQTAGGVLAFDYRTESDGPVKYLDHIITSEIGATIRYAPNQKFYQGKTYRIPIDSKYPTFQLGVRAGFKDVLNGGYNYQVVTAKITKIFYIAPFGISDWTLEAGRILGKVPYPLLKVHAANQSFSYQLNAYNLMNFLEFASDKWVALSIQHNFNGLLFNKIPLFRRLKWREVASFKGLYGGLDDKNRPSDTNGQPRFPVDENGKTLTHSLENKPYVEASVGIANIFRLFRVDYVRRVTYADSPYISKWGIRARFKIEF